MHGGEDRIRNSISIFLVVCGLLKLMEMIFLMVLSFFSRLVRTSLNIRAKRSGLWHAISGLLKEKEQTLSGVRLSVCLIKIFCSYSRRISNE